MRTKSLIAVLFVLIAPALMAGCASDEGSDIDSEAAEEIYLECAREHGIDVMDVEIGSDTFDIVLADDSPDDAEQILLRECEPLALAMLENESSDNALAEVPDGISEIDDYVDSLRDEEFSGVVLLAREGDDEVVHSFGYADRDETRENSANTAFDVGSIAKSFTAVAMLRLVDDGALALDDPLVGLIDDVPDDKAEITIRQLLNFTSGLREYHDTDGDFEPMTRDQALQRILAQDLLFDPGSDDAYSNSSYTLAAIVIEEITGRDFTEVVRELFADTGLTQTDFYGGPNLQDIDVATGYDGEEHNGNNPRSWKLSWALMGGGGIASSAGDQKTWWNAITDGNLLTTESTEVLLEEILPLQTIDGLSVRGIAGTNDFGFDAIIVEIPARELLIVAASNANPPDQTLAADVAAVIVQLHND